MIKRRRKKTAVQRLKEKMGVFNLVLPCFEGVYVYEITPDTLEKIDASKLGKSVKEWFKQNEGESFDEESFFDFIEDESGVSLNSAAKKEIRQAVHIRNESILIKRLSMLQIMQGKHYPSELTSFVQNVYSQGQTETEEGSSQSESDSEDALSFHQWVACTASIDPKIISLNKVLDVLSDRKVDSNWFHYNDLKKIQAIKANLQNTTGKKSFSEMDIRELPEFRDEQWNANDTMNPDRMVDIWFVEDFASDGDLVHLSTAAFNGPAPEERPDLRPFSEQS